MRILFDDDVWEGGIPLDSKKVEDTGNGEVYEALEQDSAPVYHHRETFTMVEEHGDDPRGDDANEVRYPRRTEFSSDQIVAHQDGEDGDAWDNGSEIEQVHTETSNDTHSARWGVAGDDVEDVGRVRAIGVGDGRQISEAKLEHVTYEGRRPDGLVDAYMRHLFVHPRGDGRYEGRHENDGANDVRLSGQLRAENGHSVEVPLEIGVGNGNVGCRGEVGERRGAVEERRVDKGRGKVGRRREGHIRWWSHWMRGWWGREGFRMYNSSSCKEKEDVKEAKGKYHADKAEPLEPHVLVQV